MTIEFGPAVEGALLSADGSALTSTAALAVNAGIAGAASGAISTGTLNGAIMGLASAEAFFAVGTIDGALGNGFGTGQPGAIAMHGVAGGLISVAEGGNFQSGFLAAGFSELAGPHIQVDPNASGAIYENTAISAITGGIGSVLGGGKFENGAITGAFGYLFNDALHRAQMASAGLAVETIAGTYVAVGADFGTAGGAIIADPLIIGLGAGIGTAVGWIGGMAGDIYNGTVFDESNSDIPANVGPGPYAGTPIPAGPSARPTADQQDQINSAGDVDGCHTCGADSPGTSSGNWVGDHQPPTALNPYGGPQVYYPQCLACSRTQDGLINAWKNGGSGG